MRNANLDKTLYTSPYMIVTDKEYTKHYYIENQRVATKLGAGMANNLINPISGTLDAIKGNAKGIATDLIENLIAYSCATTLSIEIEPQFPSIENYMQQDEEETDQYFYHSDHLGSSSWIIVRQAHHNADASGTANQHLAYMPYAESFIDQRATGHDIRYKFTGKERDSETGFDYFGARYYDSDLSIWLSVDPMASKYPSVSGYMYVLGNPIKLIDPNGMWVEGEGFFRNVFKSDTRIKAENRVTESGKQGIVAKASRNIGESKGWNVTYTTGENTKIGDMEFNLSTFNMESFDKKNDNNEFLEAVNFVDNASKKGIDKALAPLDKIKTGEGSMLHKTAQIVANINPLISVPNAFITLTKGENIYGEKTDNADLVFSIIDIVTLGADGLVKVGVKEIMPISKTTLEVLETQNLVIKAGNTVLETTKTIVNKNKN